MSRVGFLGAVARITCMLALLPTLVLAQSPADEGLDCVVLLHGLGRSARAMNFIEQQLQQQGYLTVNPSYPSTSADIDTLAEQHVGAAVEQCRLYAPARIHFVTHSMGGILARQYLQRHPLPAGSRMVMLSPPNHGSALIDKWRELPLFGLLLGPAALQLATDSPKLRELRPLALDIGIITGDGGNNGWLGLDGRHDNAVTVDSARLAEMRDFLVVPTNHVAIRRNETVLSQTLDFLVHGRFQHPPQTGPHMLAEAGGQ